jgi:hypothetical protein
MSVIASANRKLFDGLRTLGLPAGHYVITGSGPLGVRNVRQISDLDIIVSTSLWDELSAKYGVIEQNGLKRIMLPDGVTEALHEGLDTSESIQERIEQAEIIDGLPFEPLERILRLKLRLARAKDLDDIIVLRNLLA